MWTLTGSQDPGDLGGWETEKFALRFLTPWKFFIFM